MKIGIVNDSVMAAEILRRIITSCPDHQLLWTADDGSQALMRCQHELPDLILMDLMMPVMDGVEATRRIMMETPCAILIVTASVTSNSSMVFEAMGVGALDVVATPVLGQHDTDGGSCELLRKIELISKLIGCHVRKTGKCSAGFSGKSRTDTTLVAIGASTGGPQAISKVLSAFPAGFPASVIVVQHMDQKFTPGLTSWLDQQAAMPVKLIDKNETPQKGLVLVPKSDQHLTLNRRGLLTYTKEPADNFYHPSVDVFFKSLSEHWPGKVIGVVLTGMGRDGAAGLLNLREAGHHTIAQDEKTSIVYGMPKAATLLGAACEVLPLGEIGPKLLSLTNT